MPVSWLVRLSEHEVDVELQLLLLAKSIDDDIASDLSVKQQQQLLSVVSRLSFCLNIKYMLTEKLSKLARSKAVTYSN
ncbi:hypothetical protein T4A_658 [Trichinella pseudospiralis]|uniref:Uncharacterized protein n=1 Tax=Trichinella pseudospiralis TaxID=6337 RepID=A0A0V1FT37_TRIPS|nr:hypothetical protein T4A_658 [Trichinella pseudospiralis]KRY89222.1 hypothetical protein T4D_2849 [Trichinella pseudospiralis]